MNFTCKKKTLHDALQSVSRAVSTRSTLPILGNVLIDASGDKLSLMATDLEICITYTTDIQVAEEGRVTVPSRTLNEVVSSLPDGEIAISSDERDMLTLSAAKSKFTIHGLPAEEYPMRPTVPEGINITIPGPVLRDLVRKTIFAAGTDEARQVLTGVLFMWNGATLNMVSTDTHRLAFKSVPAPGIADNDVSAIIPARALQELLRILGSVDDPVEVHIGPKNVLFIVGAVQLIARLIDGAFPNYERVIPAESQKRMILNRKLFIEAVRRASIVARAESNKLRFQTNQGTLVITAETSEVGEAREEMPIELDGEEVAIAFNAEYLLDALTVLDTEMVQLSLSGPLNPGLIQADGEPDYKYVVMPMQMN